MSCFSVCCTCFILPQDQFVSTTIIICLFPVHLCKQHCLKHPTLVFPRLVVLSLENNHTHPSEGQMTILRGEGVFQGKIPKPYWNFQWCFFGGVGGGWWQWGGGCSELFQKLLRAGVWIFSRTRILWSPEFIIIIYFPVILLLWNKWPFQPWERKSLQQDDWKCGLFFSVYWRCQVWHMGCLSMADSPHLFSQASNQHNSTDCGMHQYSPLGWEWTRTCEQMTSNGGWGIKWNAATMNMYRLTSVLFKSSCWKCES